MNQEVLGIIFAILSPLFSSISTIFKTGAAKSLGPLVVVGIGGILGSLILFALAGIRREKISAKKIKANLRGIASIVCFRFLLGELLFTYGLSQTTAIKAIFFTKIEPYFVLLFAWLFLKEKIKGRYLILLTIHLIGAVLLSTGGNFNIVGQGQIGDLSVILAMALFALTYKEGKYLAEKIGPVLSSAISLLIASIIVLPFALLLTPLTSFTSSITGWAYLILYVVLFNVIALTLWFASLKSVKGWIVSTLRYVGPVLGAPFAYLLFGTSLNLIQVLGAFVILATSFVIAREHFKSYKREPVVDEIET
ncbi:MAG: hypothetical protein A2152_00060 [Candidatus Levybacteria bacterium RBG_16_35_6]|nr:MAG: hypothetical protein A2152_00060 [Candidatus Levybacteria bacterium RBG_16_35_6]